ncbi:MAG: DUF6660 family protein [Ferruginibacter sp.]
MRCIALIFVCYTFLLAFIPCGELVAAALQAETVAANTGEHQHAGEETCTPFCICNCCGQNFSVTGTAYKPLTEKPLLQAKEYFSGNSFFLPSGFFDCIWQPPRLS